MWQICDIIETFDPELDIQCFKPSVIKRHSREQLLVYLQILRSLPLSWEDSITQMGHIHPKLLTHLSQGITKVNKPIEVCKSPIQSHCHSNTLELWKSYPLWEMYSGFAKIDSECVGGDDWYLHSFCVTTVRIVEPTPLLRSVYYGRSVNRELLTAVVSY